MTFQPLGNRLLVQMIENQEEKSKGGIYIPQGAQERSQIGKVIAVGPGERRPDGTTIPADIKPGDIVVLGKYSGATLSLEGTTYMVLHGDEVLGVLHGHE